MYISENCKWTPYGTNPELDKQVDSDNMYARAKVAEQGYGLDKLINDANEEVRGEVAEQGYGLDKLVHDKFPHVRVAVARQGYCLDILVNDENSWVREEVAEQGYGLDILVNDKYNMVRAKVAEQGYGLDILINDEDWYVRDSVKDYLKSHNLTINHWIEQNPDKCVLEHKNSQVEKVTKDFIHKIDDSNKLTVQSQFDSIDEFFSTEIEDDVKMNTLVICAIDTKMPLFKVEKSKSDNQIDYKFIVDITTDRGEHFNIEAFIQSQEQLNKLIQQTVDALNLYEQFSKYADDLENCL